MSNALIDVHSETTSVESSITSLPFIDVAMYDCDAELDVSFGQLSFDDHDQFLSPQYGTSSISSMENSDSASQYNSESPKISTLQSNKSTTSADLSLPLIGGMHNTTTRSSVQKNISSESLLPNIGSSYSSLKPQMSIRASTYYPHDTVYPAQQHQQQQYQHQLQAQQQIQYNQYAIQQQQQQQLALLQKQQHQQRTLQMQNVDITSPLRPISFPGGVGAGSLQHLQPSQQRGTQHIHGGNYVMQSTHSTQQYGGEGTGMSMGMGMGMGIGADSLMPHMYSQQRSANPYFMPGPIESADGHIYQVQFKRSHRNFALHPK